jgi:hypothetical protein
MTKAPYEKPELRRLGLLRDLTRFSGFPGQNGQGGNNNNQN